MCFGMACFVWFHLILLTNSNMTDMYLHDKQPVKIITVNP